MKALLNSIILLLTALVLSSVLIPFGLLAALVMLFVRDTRCLYPSLADYLLALAVALDTLGNVLCGALFNVTLIRHGGYAFGVVGETVSSALGVNEYRGTLSATGRLFANLLNRIDPDHCERAAWAYHMKQREPL